MRADLELAIVAHVGGELDAEDSLAGDTVLGAAAQ